MLLFHIDVNCFANGVEITGSQSDDPIKARSSTDCQIECQKKGSSCSLFNFNTVGSMCYLLSSQTGNVSNKNIVSGPRVCKGTTIV